jgi:ribosomal protein S18 acetylase RimI-like enzyme
MDIRAYDTAADYGEVLRVYREVGWVDASEEMEEAFRRYIEGARTLVADLEGRPECVVTTMPGTLRYLERDLPLCAVTGVTTGRVARKQGLARHLTAHALAQAAKGGEAVAMLGMFEQGFYDTLGFGTGAYERTYSFDPATLDVSGRPSVPSNLTIEDLPAIHRSRHRRRRRHGGCTLEPEGHTAEGLYHRKGLFGMGYWNRDGTELTHHFWGEQKGENGPLEIYWMTYQTREQFLELLRLLKALSDQIDLVTMPEPAGVMLQSFLRLPFRTRRTTEAGKKANTMESEAPWQLRILDLPRSIAATRLCTAADSHATAAEAHGGSPEELQVTFNLTLTDPVSAFCQDGGWQGVAGQYTIRLGSSSEAASGHTPALPELRASVNAFSRLWIGAADADTLAFSGEIEAPESLIATLDRSWCMPEPRREWAF